MLNAEDLNDVQTEVNGKWYPARPFTSFKTRVRDAWRVLTGELVAVDFNYERRHPRKFKPPVTLGVCPIIIPEVPWPRR